MQYTYTTYIDFLLTRTGTYNTSHYTWTELQNLVLNQIIDSFHPQYDILELQYINYNHF